LQFDLQQSLGRPARALLRGGKRLVLSSKSFSHPACVKLGVPTTSRVPQQLLAVPVSLGAVQELAKLLRAGYCDTQFDEVKQ
jgi:hypothetical protein